MISVLSLIQKIKPCNIIRKFRIGDNQRYYNVGLLSKELGDNVSKALSFPMLSLIVTLFLVTITTINYSFLMHGCYIV